MTPAMVVAMLFRLSEYTRSHHHHHKRGHHEHHAPASRELATRAEG
jgi:ABC-type nickel/cobalt efflux system permease component RcnA